jgi:hypothetical protein
MDPWERGLVFSGGLSFLLSFPLIFIPLMRIVPGMAGMRVPARFNAFFGLTVVYFAARGFDRFLSRRSRPAGKTLAVAILLPIFLLDLLPHPISWVDVPREEELPEVYGWLARQTDIGALLEIPMRPGWQEAAYMYGSTRHWKPIANGYSSFIPPGYGRLAGEVGIGLPGPPALDLCERLGITHLVVHSDELTGEWRRARDSLGLIRRWEGEMGGRLELVRAFDPERVYRIVRRAPRAVLQPASDGSGRKGLTMVRSPIRWP